MADFEAVRDTVHRPGQWGAPGHFAQRLNDEAVAAFARVGLRDEGTRQAVGEAAQWVSYVLTPWSIGPTARPWDYGSHEYERRGGSRESTFEAEGALLFRSTSIRAALLATFAVAGEVVPIEIDQRRRLMHDSWQQAAPITQDELLAMARETQPGDPSRSTNTLAERVRTREEQLATHEREREERARKLEAMAILDVTTACQVAMPQNRHDLESLRRGEQRASALPRVGEIPPYSAAAELPQHHVDAIVERVAAYRAALRGAYGPDEEPPTPHIGAFGSERALDGGLLPPSDEDRTRWDDAVRWLYHAELADVRTEAAGLATTPAGRDELRALCETLFHSVVWRAAQNLHHLLPPLPPEQPTAAEFAEQQRLWAEFAEALAAPAATTTAADPPPPDEVSKVGGNRGNTGERKPSPGDTGVLGSPGQGGEATTPAEATDALDAKLSGLSKGKRAAYLQYRIAARDMIDPTDRAAYDATNETLPEGESLPPFDTWVRYLRQARNHLNQQKNKPRRPPSPSEVRSARPADRQ
ncbi:hypothetical protein [Urbifossiella limnaea]|uniref:hypothetical protein n=1 Tax=Urbifossiella limnaea TaxID=2528023 RepID=UPI00119FCA20|nr:hypothetical protein [Urbifossiella limnaea]